MPGGHEHDPIYSLSIHARLSGQFFFTFSYKKIVMEKKKVVMPCLDAIMIAFFPRNHVKFSFCPKSERKYWASAPLDIHNIWPPYR